MDSQMSIMLGKYLLVSVGVPILGCVKAHWLEIESRPNTAWNGGRFVIKSLPVEWKLCTVQRGIWIHTIYNTIMHGLYWISHCYPWVRVFYRTFPQYEWNEEIVYDFIDISHPYVLVTINVKRIDKHLFTIPNISKRHLKYFMFNTICETKIFDVFG